MYRFLVEWWKSRGDLPLKNISVILFLVTFIALSVVLSITIYEYKRNPFIYPYMKLTIDISRRRQPKREDVIDRYLIDTQMEELDAHWRDVTAWKRQNVAQIKTMRIRWMQKHRAYQFKECLDDENMFHFEFIRDVTVYQQKNYVKEAYNSSVVQDEFCMGYRELLERFRALEQIDFACTLSEYNAKNQRRLMTRALRDQIALRDNYTCQICGKYMPDGVGLQIDHIVPISKGGKSIPSNLQVLCSRCNGRKSNKQRLPLQKNVS